MSSARTTVRNVVLSMTLLSLLGVPDARAESDAGAARQEIGELKRTVEQLNTRIESLEHQLSEQPKATPPSAAPDAAPSAAAPSRYGAAPPSPMTVLREHWQQIDRGLSVQEVEGLLGPPQRTAKFDAKTVWYYSYPDVGNGSVVFVQDDSVIDWQPPIFSVWWY